jgi:hypothetical protein
MSTNSTHSLGPGGSVEFVDFVDGGRGERA